MTNEQKTSRLSHVTGVLAATAAVIAAVSTLVANLRSEKPAAPVAPAIVATTATPAESADPSPAPAQPQAMRLRLDRVQVDDDGSVGSTDWTFQVSVDGEPAFSVAMPALSDKPGENLVRPTEEQDAAVAVSLPPGKNVGVTVKGWKKGGLLGGGRGEIEGAGWLSAGFDKTAITVKGDKAKGPRFVLYFSATPVD